MTPHDIDRIARRRAAAKLGWIIHATVFVLVNLTLAGIAAAQGRIWALFPAWGWGLGLAIHGIVVYGLLGGLQERLVERERARLEPRRDAW